MYSLEFLQIEKKIYKPHSRQVDHILYQGSTYVFRSSRLYALTGPHGAGKTMLIRLALRFHHPDGGSVMQNGTPVKDIPIAVYRKSISAAFHRIHFFTDSVKEEVAFYNSYYPILPKPHLRNQVHSLLSLVRFPHGEIHTSPFHLSDTDKAKLVLARTLFSNSECLLFDSTFDYLPEEPGAEILELLHIICRQEDKLVIIATNRPNLVQYCDEEIAIRKPV